jgi:hypothetical protein
MKILTTPKVANSSMSLEQATTYLKKIGEWESVWRFDRDTILGWANFLKNKEKKQSNKNLQK